MGLAMGSFFRSRSRLFYIGMSLVMALAIQACSPSATDDSKTLKIAFFGDNTTLVSVDPFQVYWLEHRVIIRNVVESLTDQNTDTGEVIPWLAKSWSVSDDALVYTFHLRDDVSFSNGEAFDADAVKKAFDSNKAFADRMPGTFGNTYLAGYSHAKVIDKYTVQLILSRPNAGFLQATATTNLAILAPASYALSPEQRSLGQIIGTGPFVLEYYKPEVGARLVKRPGYAWASSSMRNKGEAYLDAVEISYIPEESVRNGLFLQGKVDILWPRLPFSEVDLKLFKSKGSGIQERSLPGPAINLYPNTQEGKVLADVRVRQALMRSIDRASYAHTVYNSSFPVVSSLYDVTTPYYKNLSAKMGYDPRGAEALLDSAGWIKRDDGYRYKNDKRLTLSYNILTNETPGDVLIQDQLRKVGIDLRLDVSTRAEWALKNSHGNYDLTLTYMTRADPIILQTILDPRTATGATVARSAYEPAILQRAQALFDKGMFNTAPEQRKAAYGDLQDLLIDEASAFPIAERLWQAATLPRVQGFNWTAEGIAIFGDIKVTE